MRILCLATPAPGHIDFGGQGYIKLAQKLQQAGHDIKWLCGGAQAEAIREAGMVAKDHIFIGKANLRSSLIFKTQNMYQEYLNGLLKLSDQIKHENPDLILIDRALIYAAYIAESLSIPYVAVGTPGGIQEWVQGLGIQTPGPEYKKMKNFIDSIIDDLKIECSQNRSAWVDSIYFNVCFTGKSFYSDIDYQEKKAVFINHFNKSESLHVRPSVGISFGNTTNHIDYFFHALRYLSERSNRIKIEVIAGNRKNIMESLKKEFNRPEINIHGWVNYEVLFPKLSYLICYCGIGTIWSCINSNTPMLMASGGHGDQNYNISRAAHTGIGSVIDIGKIGKTGIEMMIDTMNNSEELSIHTESIHRFKHPSNYTDDMESAAHKITDRM